MEECFICLENLNNSITLKCCNNKIHNNCLVSLFLFEHDKCPMCRKSMNIIKYLSKNDFKKIVKKLDNMIYLRHYRVITKIYLEYSIRVFSFYILVLFVISICMFFYIYLKIHNK